jgi:hypothetical protein
VCVNIYSFVVSSPCSCLESQCNKLFEWLLELPIIIKKWYCGSKIKEYDCYGNQKNANFLLITDFYSTIYPVDCHHLSREFSTTIAPVLPSSSYFPRPSPDRRSTLRWAYKRCVSRYAIAIRGPFRPNGRQSSSQCRFSTLTNLIKNV